MVGQDVSAPACHGKFSGFESRHSSKIINGQHKQRNGQHTLARHTLKITTFKLF
jgi:hypothetical protein